MRRALRIATIGLLGLACLAALAAWLALHASLPRQGGSAEIASLRSAVTVELDDLGIPRISANTLADAFAAQGFVHAQDRFFQMDLSRRSAAGELAELFGAAAIGFDSQRRLSQLRSKAAAMLARLPERHRDYLRRYADGVNAGLADLRAWPPEYLLLRQSPQAWLPEDSLLIVFALYTMMSNNDSYEQHNGALRDLLPPNVFEFMLPTTARDDRPLAARATADATGGYEPLPIPGPQSIDVRGITYDGSLNFIRQPLSPAGSNNWALAEETAGRGALLGNDPHLSLRIPNVFHRAELHWSDQGGDRVLRGVGIAGLPGILLGASEFVAWGATVSYSDQADYVVIDVDSSNPNRYLTPTGAEEFVLETELISVAGRDAPVEVEVRRTRWGPVTGSDHAGRPLVLRARWLDPDGFDLSLLDIADAENSAQAIAILHDWHGPSINWVTADRDGSIGWTINGPVPLRRNFDGSVPERWGTGNFGWRGDVMLPWTISSGADSVYSANNRQLTMPYALTLSSIELPPRRARTIAAALEARKVTDEASSLALQLDTRASAYDMLQELVLEVVPADTSDPALARARVLISEWNGFADIDSTAMPILDRYYDQLLERVIGTALKHVRDADPRFVYRWPLADEVLRRILEERPANFLPQPYADWDAYLTDILRESLPASAAARWGEVNRLDIAHPLGAVPGLGRLLAWPRPELPGNPYTLRVARPNFGAVFRMSVRPGQPQSGILQLAGGQSGHFLSPHYADQLTDWADGTPTPFMAGAAQHSYTLHPGVQNSAR